MGYSVCVHPPLPLLHPPSPLKGFSGVQDSLLLVEDAHMKRMWLEVKNAVLVPLGVFSLKASTAGAFAAPSSILD